MRERERERERGREVAQGYRVDLDKTLERKQEEGAGRGVGGGGGELLKRHLYFTSIKLDIALHLCLLHCLGISYLTNFDIVLDGSVETG